MGKTAIYYIPHQDDELLQMGVSILNHINEGYDVHLVLCTDGQTSWAKGILNGKNRCPWHKTIHRFHLSDEKFLEIRNHEFTWSSLCLGVKPENIHFRQHKDGDLSVEAAKKIILEFEKAYPDSVHMTMTYMDSHPDHAALGEGVYQLYREKYINDVRFYIDVMQKNRIDGILEPLKKEYLQKLRNAIIAYKSFVPNNNLYAVGYHSVPDWFIKQFHKPNSKYHRVEEYR